MTQDIGCAAPLSQKAFFYTEECGLALMLDRKSNRKLAMEKSLWADLVDSITAGSHPGAALAERQR